jgi:hypothetical protein
MSTSFVGSMPSALGGFPASAITDACEKATTDWKMIKKNVIGNET